MIKLIASLLFIFTTLSIAKDDTYVFEAKGEFAKELKMLVDKYSKEGKIEAKVYKKDESETYTTTLLSVFEDNTAEELKHANVKKGRIFYQKRCTKCHGVNAEKIAYNNSRVLTSLTPIQIVDALENYRSDPDYGNSTKYIMQEQAYALSTETIQSIAVYIYSLNHEAKLPTSKTESPTQTNTGVPTSYLQ